MHPRTSEVLTYLAAQLEVLGRAVAAVPPALRAWRPAPDRWSVGEVLAHVAAVERRATQLLQARLDAARAAGLRPERETSPVVPTVAIRRILDRSRPVSASPAAQPPANADAAAAWAAIAEGHDALRSALAAADGLALSEVTVPNPVFGALNVYQWVVFLGAHEARHAAQIAEIGLALEASTGAAGSAPAT